MRTTEQDSLHSNLEQKSVSALVHGMNTEDQKVAIAVKRQLQVISDFIEVLLARMERGGRLFYLGAGTSGRLGILDASECPPTFGVDDGLVVGIIAGGDGAIRKAVEHAEDDSNEAWKDLMKYNVTNLDTVIGIAASGSTPYVIGGVKAANKQGLLTACITCNKGSLLGEEAQHEIAVVVGPEFLTGSTRMKSGTAQKMVLNMITTAVMIKLGRVKGNKMVDMQLSNYKLIERGKRMVAEALGIENELAQELLFKHGSVRTAIDFYRNERKQE